MRQIQTQVMVVLFLLTQVTVTYINPCCIEIKIMSRQIDLSKKIYIWEQLSVFL